MTRDKREPDDGTVIEAGGRRRIRRRRLRWVGLTLSLTVVATFATAAGVGATKVRAQVAALREAAGMARAAVASMDLARLQTALDTARRASIRAEALLHGAVFDVVNLVPVAGRSVSTSRVLLRSLKIALDAATLVHDALSRFPADGDLVRFRTTDGRFLIDPWIDAAPLLEQAATAASRAAAIAAATHPSLLPKAVRSARSELIVELDGLANTTRDVASAAALLPTLLGGDRPVRYLLVMQNPAELRGTGGIIGGFALFDASEGRVAVRSLASNVALPRITRPVAGPPWFARVYDRYASRYSWSNINIEPDVRIVAPLIARLFSAAAGIGIDGVILLDPFALQELVAVTGKVNLPGGITLTPTSTARFLLRDQYQHFSDNLQRKAFLEAALRTVWERFASADPLDLVRALGAAARGRHLTAWHRDDDVEQLITSLGIDGRFRSDADVWFGVSVSNGAGNKMDLYTSRDIDATFEVASPMAMRFSIDVRLQNRSAGLDLPPYVSGPPPQYEEYVPRANRSIVSILLPDGASVEGISADGLTVGDREILSRTTRIPGATIAEGIIDIPSGSSRVMRVFGTIPLARSGSVHDLEIEALIQPSAAAQEATVHFRGVDIERSDRVTAETGQITWYPGAGSSVLRGTLP